MTCFLICTPHPSPKVTPSPTGEGFFVGDGVLDIPFCWTLLGADDHWSSLQVAVHLCVIPHVSPYMSFAGRRGAVPYKIIEQLYVIPSEVEGSQMRTPHHLQSRSLFSKTGTLLSQATFPLAGESPQGEGLFLFYLTGESPQGEGSCGVEAFCLRFIWVRAD